MQWLFGLGQGKLFEQQMSRGTDCLGQYTFDDRRGWGGAKMDPGTGVNIPWCLGSLQRPVETKLPCAETLRERIVLARVKEGNQHMHHGSTAHRQIALTNLNFMTFMCRSLQGSHCQPLPSCDVSAE